MNEEQRNICSHLRSLSSSEAATWLLDRYPVTSENWGEALVVLPHRSWEKPDQVRLADHYFAKVPFASGRGYQAFASFMSVSTLVSALRAHVPKDAEDISLFLYYIEPVLRRKAASDSDVALVRGFLGTL